MASFNKNVFSVQRQARNCALSTESANQTPILVTSSHRLLQRKTLILFPPHSVSSFRRSITLPWQYHFFSTTKCSPDWWLLVPVLLFFNYSNPHVLAEYKTACYRLHLQPSVPCDYAEANGAQTGVICVISGSSPEGHLYCIHSLCFLSLCLVNGDAWRNPVCHELIDGGAALSAWDSSVLDYEQESKIIYLLS